MAVETAASAVADGNPVLFTIPATSANPENSSSELDTGFETQCVTVGSTIGAGTVGSVVQANWLGTIVAIKFLRPLTEIDEVTTRAHARADFANEVRINARLGPHPHIVQCFGVCLRGGVAQVTRHEASEVGLVFEHISGGPLKAERVGGRGRVVPCALVARGVAAALAHAHLCGVMHRDVKPSNVLVAADGSAKVCDWGLATDADAPGKTGQTGTLEYMAPEVVAGREYTEKADVFSFGILLWALVVGKEYPYESNFLTPQQAADAVANAGLRPTIPGWVSEEIIVDLMRRCWKADPHDRPSMLQVACELNEFLKGEQTKLATRSAEDKSSQSWASWLGLA